MKTAISIPDEVSRDADALAAAEDQPQTLAFVTLDDRLAQAAEREGFPIVLSPAQRG
jgi:hypothetical protein